MTTVLSQKGQLVLPVPVRQQFGLEPGDDFEVAIEEGATEVRVGTAIFGERPKPAPSASSPE